MLHINTLKNTLIAACLLTGTVLYSGCKKAEFEKGVAVITYSGDFVDGGCGWVLQFGSQEYEPQNLPDTFKQEGMVVNITYKVLDESPACRNLVEVRGVMYIHKIEEVL